MKGVALNGTLSGAYEIIRKNNMAHLPTVDNGSFIGLLIKHDVFRKLVGR